ncbi:MAG: hypothetical protein U5L45_05330 [Saprospiraceae bacterium]|nr:hypothetical protein [Saprospiraceae bacterium]
MNVFDWCVEVEALPYDVDDNGDIVNLDYRNVKRVRIEDCTDEYSEDILNGQKSLTLIHQGVSLVTFNNVQNSVQGVSNTLNGSDDFDYIEDYFRTQFYQLRVQG